MFFTILYASPKSTIYKPCVKINDPATKKDSANISSEESLHLNQTATSSGGLI